MKLACCITVLIALAPWAALAAPNEAAPKETKQTAKDAKPRDCQTIKSVNIRQACLDRQAAEHTGTSSVRSPNMSDTVDRLQQEDDLLQKKLKGICRGC